MADTPTSHRPTALLTLQQSAREYGIPYSSIRKLIYEGHLPAVHLGNSKRTWVKRSDLERLIETGTERRLA